MYLRGKKGERKLRGKESKGKRDLRGKGGEIFIRKEKYWKKEWIIIDFSYNCLILLGNISLLLLFLLLLLMWGDDKGIKGDG